MFVFGSPTTRKKEPKKEEEKRQRSWSNPSLEIKQLKMFHKCIFVLINLWVQFFAIKFYYNKIILWFNLLEIVFDSNVIQMQFWFEHKCLPPWLEDGLKIFVIELQWISDYALIINSSFFVFFECSLCSKICGWNFLGL